MALRLSGRLGGPWASELERLCEGLLDEGKGVTLDLSDVGFIDERGVAAIRLVSSRGATVTSTSPFVATRLRETVEWTERDPSKRKPGAAEGMES